MKKENEKKDWTGGRASVFKTIGASNHCDEEREVNDYYATEPKATELLMELEEFREVIMEPACGEGHISKVLQDHGHTVLSSDLIDRGFGEVRDFLEADYDTDSVDADIITNPPYKYAKEFVEKSLRIIKPGRKVAMFLKLTFLEGKGRKDLFTTNPPIRVWVSSSRLQCLKNGVAYESGSATAYAWFIWEKGFDGDTIIKWFN